MINDLAAIYTSKSTVFIISCSILLFSELTFSNNFLFDYYNI